jgi:hypothetical protein
MRPCCTFLPALRGLQVGMVGPTKALALSLAVVRKKGSRDAPEYQAHAATLSSRYSWCRPPKVGSARTR